MRKNNVIPELKMYYNENSDITYIVGDTNAIKRVYNSLYKAYVKDATNLRHAFTGKSRFSNSVGTYGIGIDFENNEFFVVRADEIAFYFMHDLLKEIK